MTTISVGEVFHVSASADGAVQSGLVFTISQMGNRHGQTVAPGRPQATYSQVVTTQDFLHSAFMRAYPRAQQVEKIAKGLALQALHEFTEAKGVDRESAIKLWNALLAKSPLHLYTTDHRLGKDYAKFYIELNMVLNRDDDEWLQPLMPMFKIMISELNTDHAGKTS